ncbi:hypothetical protein PR048_021999 [Dryococelus australis]|uniref:Gelsolin-like domain-containing protein n=1 Tax=Dryococelus australis TaxID=614101 RepID=A0ABQ9GZS3_9NEOP|nr:hypothetical protein PR048_021999 [Dryococelus australis]
MWELVWHFLAGAVLLLYVASTFRRRARHLTHVDTKNDNLESKELGARSESACEQSGVLEENAHVTVEEAQFLESEPKNICSQDANIDTKCGKVLSSVKHKIIDSVDEIHKVIDLGTVDAICEGEIGRRSPIYRSGDVGLEGSAYGETKGIEDESSEEGICDRSFEDELEDESSVSKRNKCSECISDEHFEDDNCDESSEGIGDDYCEEGIEDKYSEGLGKEVSEEGSSKKVSEEGLSEVSEEGLSEEVPEEGLREEVSEESLGEEECSEESLGEECAEESLGEEECSEESLGEEECSEENLGESSEEGEISDDDHEHEWNSKNIFATRDASSEDALIKPRKLAFGTPVSFLQELTARQKELCERNKLGNNVDYDLEPEKTIVKPHKIVSNPIPFLEELRLRQKALRSVNREAKENESDSGVSCLQGFPAERDEVVGGGSILADRKGKLDAAKQGWKKRVEPTDAVKFSVAGKMKIENKAADQSPTLSQQNGERRRRIPQRSRFRSKMAQLKEISSTPCSPQKEVTPTFKRSISAPGGDEEDLTLDQETTLNELKVVVPRADDETFAAFFRSASSEQAEKEQLQINDEDLDLVISKSSRLSVQKRTVKVQRRHVASRNPIKALASRVNIQEEYVEVQTGVAEKELKRLNMEKLAKNSSFAVEALAGLASKEDFTSVALKKALPSSSIVLPYKDLMLLHVKGRRHVQTRLVEPSPSSINSGDSYVLVTPMDVFHWVGTYANVIERSRGAEVALHIQQKRDMGYYSGDSVVTIHEEKLASCVSSAAKKFWRLLGGDENSKAIEAGHPDEDELYESSIIDTNVVYEVEDNELVPMNQYIGSIPKIEMLDPSKSSPVCHKARGTQRHCSKGHLHHYVGRHVSVNTLVYDRSQQAAQCCP